MIFLEFFLYRKSSLNVTWGISNSRLTAKTMCKILHKSVTKRRSKVRNGSKLWFSVFLILIFSGSEFSGLSLFGLTFSSNSGRS
jgi:hypothetical protein